MHGLEAAFRNSFLLAVLLWLLCPQGLSAQTRSIKGEVTDYQGEPLIGVSIMIEGTRKGTISDEKGQFAISGVKSGDVLVFSYIGFEDYTLTVGKRDWVEVEMSPDAEVLDDVVVVGYGTQKKSDLTGSIASVGGDAMQKSASLSAAESLRGMIAGVNVINTGGKPGAEMEIEIRGFNTIGETSPPLIIIDGVEGDMAMFSALNPGIIEKVDVLKDASATAVYGSRGSNGVVIVTTKTGKEGKTVVRYDGNYGIRFVKNAPDMMTADEFAKMHDVMDVYYGVNRSQRLDDDEKLNVALGRTTDWIDMLIGNGMQTSHNLTVSGGNKKETHFLNIGYTKEEGNMKPEGFDRLSASMKLNMNITDIIKVGGSMNVNYTNTDLAGGEYLRSIYRTRPTTRCYDDDGNMMFWLNDYEQQLPNPLYDQLNSSRKNRRVQVWGNVYVELRPWKPLVIRSDFKPNFSFLREGTYEGTYTKANAGRNPATASLRKTEDYSYTWDNTANFNKSFGKHKLTGTALFSMKFNQRDRSYMSARGMKWETLWNNFGAADEVQEITSSKTISALMSGMLRFNYNYADRYLLTVTGRMDGSSKLSEGNKWGFFPSAAIGWNISNEPFMKNAKRVMNNFKIRLSYGVSGNDRVDAYSSYTLLEREEYDFGGDPAVGFVPVTLASKNLRWEKSAELNLGLDLGFFKDRIKFTADIYTKTTTDLILTRKLPTHIGYEEVSDNVGSLNNRGIELTLSTINISNRNFSWTTDINFAMNRNKILELYGDNHHDLANGQFIGYSVKSNYAYDYEGIWQIGECLPDDFTGTPTYTTKNKYGQTPGQAKVKDWNNDYLITAEDDMAIIGTRDPDWTGGMTNTFYYKGFDLSVFVYARIGEQKLSTFHETFAKDYNGRFNVLNYDYWTPENTDATHWAPGSQANAEYRKAANYLDCSFVKVGNITLGYEFPSKWLSRIRIDRLRLYVTAYNPFTFTKYDGWDPEWAERSVNQSSLANTTLLFGVNLTF